MLYHNSIFTYIYEKAYSVLNRQYSHYTDPVALSLIVYNSMY